MSQNKYYIYMAWHAVTGEPIYVGKGSGGRIHVHNKEAIKGKHANKAFNDYVAIHGPLVFEIVRDKISSEEAFYIEIDLIYHFGRQDLGSGSLFNRTDGGEGGKGPKTEEHKRKIGVAITGIKRSPSTCAAISKSKRGKPNPKMSIIATARFKGVPKTPEHNAKNSAAQKGRPKTSEQKAKFSIARYAYLARRKKELEQC